MATELEQIAKRIRMRDQQQAADRKRQRELIRERIREGRTWDQVQAEAQVSRPTLRDALRRDD
jgi:AraC-like DNA-binding protein